MHKFRELKVWQRAMDFTVKVYELTAQFPKSEQFGLVSQLRRAATSIPLNIAEGAGAGSDAEFRRFLSIAARSGYEIMTGLEISQRLGYANEEQGKPFLAEVDEIVGMLVGLMRKLESKTSRRP
ncbi:MAG: four helix bundle protein [Chloroflexi bacterium]|nr:four helix bundle protein [Chloroflexota bacterium]MBI3764231.1 four helix bundle protein [Chloroflexota bacterium]